MININQDLHELQESGVRAALLIADLAIKHGFTQTCPGHPPQWVPAPGCTPAALLTL